MSIRYEPGAPAIGNFIPLCVPELRGNEWEYVKECLDTNWVSSVGSYVDKFERMMAEAVGTPYAIAAVNGTAALHVALLVAGVEPGDEVLVSALTFIAPANAIRYANAHPVFIDAEPNYWVMDVQKVQEFLQEHCEQVDGEVRNKTTGRRVKAIVPVHVLGHPVDMDALMAVARRYNLAVIEDATESLGSTYKGRATGALGDIGCFSYNGNKLITTGGGGMIVTANPEWAKRAKYLTTQAKDDPLEYVHHEIGFNYRLTNVLAAIGVAQMEQLNEYIAIKKNIAHTYFAGLADVSGITAMPQAEWADSSFWLFTIKIDPLQFGMDSRALLKVLDEQQIQSRPLWQPLHLSKAHAGAPVMGGAVAEALNRDCLSLPCSVGLTSEQQQRVIAAIRGAQR